MKNHEKPWETMRVLFFRDTRGVTTDHHDTEWESAHFLPPTRGHNWPFRCLDDKKLHFSCMKASLKEAPFWNVMFPFMGIAQRALDPAPPASVCQMGNVEHFFRALFLSSVFLARNCIFGHWKKVVQTIHESVYIPPPLVTVGGAHLAAISSTVMRQVKRLILRQGFTDF